MGSWTEEEEDGTDEWLTIHGKTPKWSKKNQYDRKIDLGFDVHKGRGHEEKSSPAKQYGFLERTLQGKSKELGPGTGQRSGEFKGNM